MENPNKAAGRESASRPSSPSRETLVDSQVKDARNTGAAAKTAGTDNDKGPPRRGSVNSKRANASANCSMQLSDLSEAFREVAREIKPSVVQVSVEIRPGTHRRQLGSQLSPEESEDLARRYGVFTRPDAELSQFYPGSPRQGREPDFNQYNVPLPFSSASGWIYDDAGHVVTNRHVIANADRITLTFHDGTESEAKVIGFDPQTDIALLKTDKPGLIPARRATEPVEQGDIVLAIGSPFRYAFSVSQGIVSATGRQMGILGPQGYENFIQTDAAINPGNSGGPLANARGEVVGMNTAIASQTGASAGIGFAIPVQMIRDVVEELLKKGKVERGYLGVMIDDDERLIESFGVKKGVLVEDLLKDGPADRAGLTSGDVIQAIDGRPIATVVDFRRRIAKSDPGQTVKLAFVRDGKEMSLNVTLEQQPIDENSIERSPRTSQPDNAVEAESLVKLGFERMQAITDDIAHRYRLEVQGVAVLNVRPFSAAAIAGLNTGTIITQVQGKKVTDIEELRKAVEGHDLKKGIRMRAWIPGGSSRYVLLSLDG